MPFWRAFCGFYTKNMSTKLILFLSCLFIKTWQLTPTQHHINVYSTANYLHTAQFVFNNFQLQTFFNFKLALNLGGLAKNHLLDLFCLSNFYFTSFDLQYKTLNDHGHFCKLLRPNFCSQWVEVFNLKIKLS